MSWDNSERRRIHADGVISDERVERLMASVMARLEAQPVRKPDIRTKLLAWLAQSATPRFAMPMTVAAALGVMVSLQLRSEELAFQLSDLIAYTTLYQSGF